MPSLNELTAPGADEYAPFYAGYVAQVIEPPTPETLRRQGDATLALLSTARDDGDFAYAEGKWTVRQLLGHITDTERVMSYRLLRIARGDATPLPGFDENAFMAHAGFGDRTLADLAAEFDAVRQATVRLVASLGAEALSRRGVASGAPVSARALLYIIAGHELHHRALLVQRYGLSS
jgi:uncharacterized damage-inducible protein DinB